LPVSGALVRGVGIYKTATKHMQAETTRSAFEIALWEKNFFAAVSDMIEFYRRVQESQPKHVAQIVPAYLGDACMAWMRPCSFMDSCKSPNGEVFLESEVNARGGQHIWLPHLHERKPLGEFLDSLSDEPQGSEVATDE
jgi:hypothetical protein